jgi:hypothetical protein
MGETNASAISVCLYTGALNDMTYCLPMETKLVYVLKCNHWIHALPTENMQTVRLLVSTHS